MTPDTPTPGGEPSDAARLQSLVYELEVIARREARNGPMPHDRSVARIHGDIAAILSRFGTRPAAEAGSLSAIRQALESYRCSEFLEDETTGLPLVDRLTHGSDIGPGKREIESLANHIYDSLPAAEPSTAQADKSAAPAEPARPIVMVDGVARFKENRIVVALLEHSRSRGYGLNEIAQGDFTPEERMELAQLIGYSVSGYGSLSYVTDESYDAAEVKAQRLYEAATPSTAPQAQQAPAAEAAFKKAYPEGFEQGYEAIYRACWMKAWEAAAPVHVSQAPAEPSQSGSAGEALAREILEICRGWSQSTFSWQGDDPDGFAKASKAHDEECVRRISAALSRQAPAAPAGALTYERAYELGQKYHLNSAVIEAIARDLGAPTPAEPAQTWGDARRVISHTIGFSFEPGELQTVNADDLLRLAEALCTPAEPAKTEAVDAFRCLSPSSEHDSEEEKLLAAWRRGYMAALADEPATAPTESAKGLCFFCESRGCPHCDYQTTAKAEPGKTEAPDGFVLVPLRPTKAMADVMDSKGWAWEDLLAAAEAITNDQYTELEANKPVAWRRWKGKFNCYEYTDAQRLARDGLTTPDGEDWEPLSTPPTPEAEPDLDECECGYGCPPKQGCRHPGESEAEPAKTEDHISKAHKLFEEYVADAIDKEPEPLRRLGEWLSRVLDEDDWKTAERMLLGAALSTPPTPEAEPAQQDTRYEAFEQKGPKRHCLQAQVFGPDGRSVLCVDGMEDPAEATRIAQVCANALNAATPPAEKQAAPSGEGEA